MCLHFRVQLTVYLVFFFFFSSRRRHTRFDCDWSSDVCSSDLAALQEDVDAIGLSILSGAHMTLFPRILDELKKRGLDDMVIWAGGIIPEGDIPKLREMGIQKIFGPGSPTTATIDFLRQLGEAHSRSV